MLNPEQDPRPEFAFINWVRNQSRSRPEVVVSIGDDAAILNAPGRQWISTVDVLAEGVHFSLENVPPELVGRKALAVNLSDIAAMAGEPCAAFVGLVLPQDRTREFAEAIYRGLFSLAEEWNVCIAGGDTNSWNGPLVISVTLLGLTTGGGLLRRGGTSDRSAHVQSSAHVSEQTASGGPVLRCGAKPGDWILVTGALGGSLASGRHLTFTPRIREALALHQQVTLHALIDLSDGLSSDLFQILDQSGVGAVLDGDDIPIHDDVDASRPHEERLQHALNDGEDFELLLTVSPEQGRQLLRSPPFETRLTKIGEITATPGAALRRGERVTTLTRGGWSHRFGE